MEDHILDLDKRQWAVSRFGLTIVGTWVRIDMRWRPCMAILRNHAYLRPCVIPLENAWMWSDEIGSPVEHAQAILFRLGVDPNNPDNVSKLISLVNSRMADLVAMPPRPPSAEEQSDPVAELTIRDELHGTREVEI